MTLTGRVVPLDFMLGFTYGRRYLLAAEVVHQKGLEDIAQVLEVLAIEVVLKAGLFEAEGDGWAHGHDLVLLYERLPNNYQQSILDAHRSLVENIDPKLEDPDAAFSATLHAIRHDFPGLRYAYEGKRRKGGTITTVRATLVAMAVWQGTGHVREGLPLFRVSHKVEP